MVPECAQCKRELTASRVLRRRRKSVEDKPRLRPELWWRCLGCGWFGFQRAEGEQLRPMRQLQGEEADCFFCGEDQSNVASDVYEQDGELRDWVLCLSCGRSNPRRVAQDS